MIKQLLGGGSGGRGRSFSGFLSGLFDTFLKLLDTPNSYTGYQGYLVQVQESEGGDGLIFVPGRGQVDGVASLDSGGKVPAAQIPPIAISEFLGTVASQPAMLALTGQVGDWCIRSDLGMVFIIITGDGHLLTDWQQLAYPATPAHAFAGGLHTADSVANIQSKVSDGSLFTTKAAEISALTAKTPLVNADLILIEDSAAANAKKKASIGDLPFYLTGAKINITHTQFQTGALTNTITLFSLPAGCIVLGVRLKVSTVFTGTAITNYYLSIGYGSGTQDLLTEYDSKNITPGNEEYAEAFCFQSFNYNAAVNLNITARSVGANLSASSQGAAVVEIYYIPKVL